MVRLCRVRLPKLAEAGAALLVVGVAIGTLGCPGSSYSRSPSISTAPAAPEPRRCPAPSYEILDLTQRLDEDDPVAPGGVPFSRKVLVDYPDGHRTHEFHVGDSTGTHVVAPSHSVEGARSVDALRPEELVVPVVVLDVSAKAKDDPDYAISGNDIVDWEDAFGPVPVGGVVLAYTGWGAKFANPEAYLGKDDQGVMHFPGFAADAAALLVERDVVGIGIDTLSVDPGQSVEPSAHQQLLKAGKLLIENLANLERLPTTGAILIVGVLPVTGGTQAQARVLALLPEGVAGEAEEEGR